MKVVGPVLLTLPTGRNSILTLIRVLHVNMSQFTMLLRKEAEKCANMQDYVLAHVFYSTAVLLEEKNEGWGKFQEVLTSVLSEFQDNHAVMYRSTVLRRLKLPKYASK